MARSLTIKTPPDYLFFRDACSYGYFLLAPNLWSPAERTLTRPLDLPGGMATFRIAQPGGKGRPLAASSDRSLTKKDKAEAERLVTRMLRLDDAGVAEFHRVDRRWKRSGRGRLFRSPTFFEDLVKTVTSCNVTWPSTVGMNRRLCELINPAFPRPSQMARRRPSELRARCGVGYRDRRLVELARMVASGDLDVARLEDPATSDEEAYKTLLDLPGIGPYGAGNLMQLLGRYSRLALDTESIRHAKNVLGMRGAERVLLRRLQRHYEPFGDHRFRSYWFELWTFYESKHGPAWTWEPKKTGTAFTAAKLNSARQGGVASPRNGRR